MLIKSKWQFDIPDCSLPTLLFGSPTQQVDDTKPQYIDADDPDHHYLTKHGYRLLAQRLAAGLRRKGFKPGDRLLLYSGNNIYFPAVLMGVTMAGGIFTGANPGYVAREVSYQLDDSEARFLLCATGSLEVGLEAARESKFPKDQVFRFDNTASAGGLTNGVQHWSELLGSEEEGKNFVWDPLDKPGQNDTTIALNYSSGTTGRPKGVEITHKNYVANSLTQKSQVMMKQNHEEILADARYMCFLPLYHAMAQTHYGVTAPLLGVPTYIMPKFDFIKVLDNIQRFRITTLALVPPIVVMMAKHPDVKRGKWDLSSVRTAVAGAAPLGRPACEEFEALWKGTEKEGQVNLQQGWGMTEGTCTLTMVDPDAFVTEAHVGELAPNNVALIMKEDGTGEAQEGERGEVWVKGPTVMKGYWRNEKATKETLTPEGFLVTGDIAHIKKDGNIFIVDRMKELIKVKGNQVAPAELEALLLDHPGVNDAAVIGVPRDGDEAPRAFIVKVQGKNPSEQDIAQFLAKKVVRYKQLTGGVQFVDEIPKNPSGKILRRQLREMNKKKEDQQAKL